MKLFGNLRNVMGLAAGHNAVDAAGATVGEVLRDLCTTYPALEEAIFDGRTLGSYIRVMINGRDIELLEGLDTEVSESDQVAIFPPIAGGLM